jgi:hypothetical protein
VSDIRVVTRRLEGISTANSSREGTVHLVFGGVALNVRVLEVQSFQVVPKVPRGL